MRKRVLSTHLLLTLLAILAMQQAYAREPRYIYIQSEHDQPYNVYINGKTYNSNATGYLLIPELVKGDYIMQVGFANTAAFYEFSFAIGDEDKGFSLKQGIDNGWTLFDLVNFNSIKGSLAMERPKKMPERLAVPKTSGVGAIAESPATIRERKVTVPVAAPIRKIYEKISQEGIDQVYVVPKTDGTADTVILFVPAIKPLTHTSAYNSRSLYVMQTNWPVVSPLFTRRRLFYL